MSQREYGSLMAGGTLCNTTDHGKRGKQTDSVGFCFFPEAPEEAIHWLSYIVDTDVCVTFDIADHLLTKRRARYRDPERDKNVSLSAPPATCWRTEYSLTEYSLRTAKVLSHTDKYRGYADAGMSILAAVLRVTEELEKMLESVNEEDEDEV